MNYLLVIAATVLLAFEFALSKRYQMNEGTAVEAGLKFNALSGLFSAVIFFAISGFHPGFSLFSLLMAFAMSLCAALYSIIGFRILKEGNMALYSLFLMSGGMLLPYVYGVVFLDEPLTILRICGVLAILAAVILSNKARYRVSKKILLLCVSIFCLNGLVSIISKCHQVSTALNPVSSEAFVMYSGIGKFLFSSVTLLFIRPSGSRLQFTSRNTPLIVAGAAAISGVSYLFQLIGAINLPATVLYPMVTGGCILFSAFAGKFFFREKIARTQWISIALCFVGTLLFL